VASSLQNYFYYDIQNHKFTFRFVHKSIPYFCAKQSNSQQETGEEKINSVTVFSYFLTIN